MFGSEHGMNTLGEVFVTSSQAASLKKAAAPKVPTLFLALDFVWVEDEVMPVYLWVPPTSFPGRFCVS